MPSIRDIPPEAADLVRSRIARDRAWYAALIRRMRKLAFIRDDDTHSAICAAVRVEHALFVLGSSLDVAGTVKVGGEVDCGKFCGENI